MRLIRKAVACVLAALVLLSSAVAAPNCSDWFENDLSEVIIEGLLPDSFWERDLSKPIDRQEICELLVTFWNARQLSLPRGGVSYAYNDTADPYILQCSALGLVSGYGDGSFGPHDTLNRQQMFCIIYRLMLRLEMPMEEADVSELNRFADSSAVDLWAQTPAAVLLRSGIVTGSDGCLNPTQSLTHEQALMMLLRIWRSLPAPNYDFVAAGDSPTPVQTATPTVSQDPSNESNESEETPVQETYEEKYVRIFGDLSASKYRTAEEAEAHMVTITVPVWNYNTEHIKVQTSRTFKIHEALADTVMAIFVEIFNGDEQFPIYSVGGYAWRGDGTSEHNWGLAIDINPDENYYVYHGVPTTGSHWTPGEDPYSIPEDGDVVRAFAKYGFSWGGNAWKNTQDYMHFSYFGT